MKRRKKIKLQYKKERVVFSDILPYELPIIFQIGISIDFL